MLRRHRGLLPWIALLVIWTVWGSTYLAIRVMVSTIPPASICIPVDKTAEPGRRALLE